MRPASDDEAFDAVGFVTAAKEFIPLLRQHILKENNVLFQMAGNVMSKADDADMDERFNHVEQERGLEGMHERFEAEVADWERQIQ